MDKIVQVDANGNVLWSWDTYNYIPLSEASPFNQTNTLPNGQTVEDFTHANSIDWDYNNSIIYLNLRNKNTFYAINQTTGNIIWACGEFGNFTLLGANGQPLPSVKVLMVFCRPVYGMAATMSKKWLLMSSPCLTTIMTIILTLLIAIAKCWK